MPLKQVHNWHQSGFIFAASLVLVAKMLAIGLDFSTQVVALTVLVTLMGLPHGAVDPLVARHAGLWRQTRGLIAFSFLYLLLVIAVVFAWLMQPGIVFSLLLLLSVWHFSGDWRTKVARPLAIGISLGIVTLPAMFHPAQVETIFSYLGGPQSSVIVKTMTQLAPVGMLSMVLAAARLVSFDLPQALELALLMALAIVLPPLLFFICYFCLLHSPRHFIHIAANHSLRDLASFAIPFTLSTVLLGIAVFAFIPTVNLDKALLQILFIGILALTVPHMVLTEFSSKSMTLK